MSALQGSLFDSGEDIRIRSLETAQRIDLGRGAWVEVVPEWIAGAAPLFELLADRVPWQSERRKMYDRTVDIPRLLSFYGEEETLPHPIFDEARVALNARFASEVGGPFRSTGFCLYRDGHDGVAWHGDTIGRRSVRDTLVAIISLGNRRRLLLRPKGGGRARKFEVGGGDLLVMGGSCQRTWEHSIPKTARPVGPRISVQMRPRGVT
ncbi:MAG TPA: alpha-ketoglutarate-dependent dioxygenase AlkB [Acidimicrobiales bacterium]|nr:alpha-ketoglutarate-dependent dioxygenase AlkB [Acidimicrobiales bacterium]